MTRIEIEYGERRYVVADASLDELQAQIAEGVSTGAHWLLVDEDHARSAYLLLTPGVPLVLLPLPDARSEDDEEDPRAGLPGYYEFDESWS